MTYLCRTVDNYLHNVEKFAILMHENLVKTNLVRNDMPKRTHQPKTRHQARKQGFRARMRSKAGRLVLRARRLKNRSKLTV